MAAQNAHKVFNVVRVETYQDGDEEKKRYHDVGTVLIRENGKNGALWLNMFDQDYALFLREPKPDADKR